MKPFDCAQDKLRGLQDGEWRGPWIAFGLRLLALVCILGLRTTVGHSEQLPLNPSQEPGTFQVTVSEGMVSLDATEASVVAVFQEIGQQAGITVESPPGLDEKITLSFERVPLEEALKRVSANVAIFYAPESKGQAPRIVRVVLHSVGTPGVPSVAPSKIEQPATLQKEAKPSPEPFKFEFDPSQYEKK